MSTTLAPEAPVEVEPRVRPLELFFDLVFVLAITQVTTLMANDATWGGLVRGLSVLVVLWFAWAPFAWLTNATDPEEGATRLAMFAITGALLVAALAVPHAFGADALAFGIAYAAVRAGHILLFAIAPEDAGVRQAIVRLAPGMLTAGGLLVVASAFDGAAQQAIWLAAIAADLAGPYLSGVRGWQVSPGHFAERHGLIVIIAIGESIVSIGVAATGLPLGGEEILAALLGIVIAAGLWWTYFDVVALVAERRLRRAEGEERARMARDSYSYLHLPMVAGIVLLALGIKKSLGHLDDSLAAVPAAGLCGGVALYLLGHIGFRLRNVHSLNRPRVVTVAVLIALAPAATALPALASVSAVAAVMAALIGYETVRYAAARERIRHATQ